MYFALRRMDTLSEEATLSFLFVAVFSKSLTEYGMQPYGPPCGNAISVQI